MTRAVVYKGMVMFRGVPPILLEVRVEMLNLIASSPGQAFAELQASNRGKAFGALFLTASLGGMVGSLYATNIGATGACFLFAQWDLVTVRSAHWGFDDACMMGIEAVNRM